jgi:DNA-binding NtrC family response regulator
MGFPRILVIDDQLGGVRADGRNRLREDLCLTVGLRDETGDGVTEPVDEPIAEAVFHRGQSLEDGQIRNDLPGTLTAIRKGWLGWPRWALVLLDMQFKTGLQGGNSETSGIAPIGQSESYFGLEILEQIWQAPDLSDIPVVVLSSMVRDQIEARFADQGAFDFVDKNDLTRERLRQLIETYGLIESDSIIGRSVPFLKCLREARQRAFIGNDNILLLGESGTGKEVLARYIHDMSPRRQGPYVTVYTQGVPETLIEDRLFGHEKGGYSGATSSQPGAAEQAHKGSLFIDEFGDVPALIQSKLLRLLDKNTRESQRLGARADTVRKLDLQVILATNRLDMLELDGFRKDLLFRVRTADAIWVPPLRERREDIPLLAQHFVSKSEAAFGSILGVELRIISMEAIQALCDHDWPDNVRGLEQVIESAVYRFPKLRVLSAAHLRLPGRSPHSKTIVPTPGLEPATGGGRLPQLLQQLGSLDLTAAALPRTEWAGKLPDLQATFARAAGALLRAALVATLKPTPENPAGELRIHPAVKLAMGDSSLSASRAADVIKRVMSIDPEVQTELMEDPLLAAAYRTATRLRPKRSRGGASKA